MYEKNNPEHLGEFAPLKKVNDIPVPSECLACDILAGDGMSLTFFYSVLRILLAYSRILRQMTETYFGRFLSPSKSKNLEIRIPRPG